MADLVAQIEALVRPLAEDADLDLVDVVVAGEGTRRRVKVVVDRKGGVDLSTCQRVSRALGKALDDVDPLTQRYTLEVTSPGTDRPLVDRRSFDRVEGRVVRAVLRDGEGDATREVQGTVTAAHEDAAVLTDPDGTEVTVPYDTIVKATQVLPW